MSYDFVGLENLPNVYIEKILLRNNNPDTFIADVSILLLDEVFENFYVWSDDSIIFDYLKIGIVATTNTQLIEQVSNGSIIPLPKVLRENRLMLGTQILTTSPKESIVTRDLNSRRYSKKVSLKMPLDTFRATLFAFAYIDSVELSKDLEVALTGPLKNYCGPVTSENVIVNGSAEKSTFIYRELSGDVWAGPVHEMPNGRFMGGSFHDIGSPVLEQESVYNSKILDTRLPAYDAPSGFSVDQRSLVSGMSTSLTNEADLIGTFSLDMRSLILSKTKYGKKMFNVSTGIFERFATSVRINSLEIRRQQVKFTKGLNKLGTAKYNQKLIGSYKTIASTVEVGNQLVATDSVSQIFIVEDPLIKTYQFIDVEMTERTRGEYRYELVVSMVDKSKDFLSQRLAQMNANISNLKVSREVLFRPSKYDKQNNRLNPGTQVPSIFQESIVNYCDNLSLILNMDDEQKENLIQNKTTIFTHDNYLNSEAEKFIAAYSALATKFTKVFDIQEKTLRLTSGGNTKKTTQNGIISAKHVFDNIVQFDKVKSAYDYLGINSNKSLPLLSKQQYMKRANLEVSRFFDTKKSHISNDLVDLDTEDMNSIRDVDSAKVGFFSPLSFKFGNQVKDLTSLQNLDIDGIAENFVFHMVEKQTDSKFSTAAVKKQRNPKSKSSPRKIKRPIKKRRMGRMKYNFRKIPFKINNLKKNDHSAISKYLGENSEMANIEGNLDTYITPPQSQQVMNKIAITNGLSAKRSKKSLDLLEKNNAFEKFKSSKKYNPRRLKMIPVSIKSIMNSRSNAAKNNILDSDSDILKDSETKVATEMMFYSTQQIQYFSGFELDVYGFPDVSRPMWKDVTPISLDTNQRLVCRMRYVEIPELEIRPAPEFKLTALNSTFIISNEPLSTKMKINEVVDDQFEIALELPEVGEIVYASSNYVRQSEARSQPRSVQQIRGDRNAQDSRY